MGRYGFYLNNLYWLLTSHRQVCLWVYLKMRRLHLPLDWHSLTGIPQKAHLCPNVFHDPVRSTCSCSSLPRPAGCIPASRVVGSQGIQITQHIVSRNTISSSPLALFLGPAQNVSDHTSLYFGFCSFPFFTFCFPNDLSSHDIYD